MPRLRIAHTCGGMWRMWRTDLRLKRVSIYMLQHPCLVRAAAFLSHFIFTIFNCHCIACPSKCSSCEALHIEVPGHQIPGECVTERRHRAAFAMKVCTQLKVQFKTHLRFSTCACRNVADVADVADIADMADLADAYPSFNVICPFCFLVASRFFFPFMYSAMQAYHPSGFAAASCSGVLLQM